MRSYTWPQAAVWETTLACDMRCRHCGSYAGRARAEELPTRVTLDLCDQLIDIGCSRVILSGGETFLREDWEEIATRLLRGRCEVGIISNGLMLGTGSALLDRLTSVRLESGEITVGISLDGLEETHDSIRGMPGSFRAALRAVDLLMERSIAVVVLTTVNRMNLLDLLPLRDEVIYPRRPYAWQVQTSNYYGRMRAHPEWVLADEDYMELAEILAESRRLRRSEPRTDPADCIGYYGILEGDLRETPWNGCQAGLRCVGIQSNGNVKGCLSLIDDRFVEGNIRERSLLEIWDTPGAFAYNREADPGRLEGLCAGCEHGRKCHGGCRSSAHSHTGSLYSAPYCLYGFQRARPSPSLAGVTGCEPAIQ
ncbi:MAG: radical SAM protein [Acidobacteriota bacterium]